jgi:quercetin dioxygenase-like cupin family protein
MHTATAEDVTYIPAGSGQPMNVIGEQITIKVSQADTDGAFTMADLVLQPGGGPPPHTHVSAETFLIHEGELEFTRMVDGVFETFRATAGDSVFIPSNAVHTYRTVSDSPSRATVFFTPGTDMEQFFRDVAAATGDAQPGPPTAEAIAAVVMFSEKYGGTILLPNGS